MGKFSEYMASRARAPEAGNDLVDAALALAAKGLPVFPCGADKMPLTERGFHDATTDPATNRRRFAWSKAVMIGAPAGKVSGFVVVDVDMKEGQQGRAWLDANSHRMVQTRTIRTGSGGLHLYFKWPGQPVKNSASKIAPNIDVRGDGGYVIVAPSPGYSVADDAPMADVPDWLLPALCPPEPVYVAPPPRTVAADGASVLGRQALQERCDAIRNAWDGAKHTTINESAFAVGGLVSTGHLAQSEAWTELREALGVILPRCKDQRAAQNTLRRAFYEGMGKPQSVAPPEPDVPDLSPIQPFLAKLAARREAGAAPAAPPPPLDVPPALMDVPGALRLFVDHCEATAISPQPFLSLAAGIAMIGALAGRRFRTTTDLRTNIYVIGVADSGGGKDHARKVIKRALFAAGLSQYLGGSDIASGSGLRTALLRHPAMLFQIDEFGDWLRDVLGERAATHKRQIAAMLKELSTSANVPWQGIEYADQTRAGKPREDVQHPHACLYGTTTPGQLWTAIAGASMHDGMMARMLLFVSPCSYPDFRVPELIEPPAELLEALQAIAAGVPADGDRPSNVGSLMLASTAPQPHTVAETAAATKAWHAMRDHQLAMQRKAEGTYVTAIAARLAENAMKLALVRAVARADLAAGEVPVIDVPDVQWGRAVAQHCIDTLLREAGDHVAENERGRNTNRVLQELRKKGPQTMSKLLRSVTQIRDMGEKERREVFQTLVTAGMIEAVDIPSTAKGGRPTQLWQVVEQDE